MCLLDSYFYEGCRCNHPAIGQTVNPCSDDKMPELYTHIIRCRNKIVRRRPMPGSCKHHKKIDQLQGDIDLATDAARFESHECLRMFREEVGVQADNTEWV